MEEEIPRVAPAATESLVRDESFVVPSSLRARNSPAQARSNLGTQGQGEPGYTYTASGTPIASMANVN